MTLKDLKIIFRRISMVVGFLIPIYFILPQVFVSLRCGATGNRAFEGYADNKGTTRHEQGAFGILCVRNPCGGVAASSSVLRCFYFRLRFFCRLTSRC
ncbi:MAG: hypothetical protein DRN91_04875 [Candidatus Alkanophagales archaeon]|nr:MAG: hypothetical protein DRN91_04875 [Candidatus Alkanophagales archaeon]